MNPFASSEPPEISDEKLIKNALNGDRKSLNTLMQRHQPYVYNIAWKMTGNSEDAADLSQEVMIKIMTSLSTFKGTSSFRTWAYRIVRNHFLNDQDKPLKFFASNFDELGQALDSIPNVDLTEEQKLEQQENTREVRLNCLSGMLLCLSKEQRMIYIIGELFRADHTIGSEIMEMSKANYRMKLSKARKDLIQFMQHKCGLVDKNNPCRCHKKVTVSLEAGLIDAKNLLYNRKEYSTYREQLEDNANFITEDADRKYLELHREHSFKTDFKTSDFLKDLLLDSKWTQMLNLN